MHAQTDRIRVAVATFADYTFGTVIAMFQLAVADRGRAAKLRDVRDAPRRIAGE